MKKIFAVTLVLVVAIWAGSAQAHPMPWSSSSGENNVWGPVTTPDFSSYGGLGGQQGSLPADGNGSRLTGEASSYANWNLNESDNGQGALYYLYYWPRDVLWNDVKDSRYTSGYIIETNPIPEPATMLLLGIGLFGLARTRLQKKNK